MNILQRVVLAFVALASTSIATAAGKLGIEDAWIRVGPPGAEMLAGYATLRNSGDAAVSILTIQSDAFRGGSIHETAIDNGVSKMRKLSLELAPGSEVKLSPGGKHLMLTQPRKPIVAGDRLEVVFLLNDGTRVPAIFEVLPADDDAGDAHKHH